MSGRRVRSWDMPVVRALDALENIPGFRSDQVEWDSFRFWRTGRGEQMQWASIYAYPTGPERGFVRFAVADGEFTVTDQQRRALTSREVADALNVPTASAEKAVTLVIPALATALTRFNAAHTPTNRRTNGNCWTEASRFIWPPWRSDRSRAARHRAVARLTHRGWMVLSTYPAWDQQQNQAAPTHRRAPTTRPTLALIGPRP